MSHGQGLGSAEFITPDAVRLPEARGTAQTRSISDPSAATTTTNANTNSNSGTPNHTHGGAGHAGPVTFADEHRYQQRYTVHVNMLNDSFAPSALYLARKGQATPYAPLTAGAIQTHVQPYDYSLRPPSYASHQAAVDFYRACHGRYNVSVNFDPKSEPQAEAPAATYDAAVAQFELLTLGAHAHGGRGLGAAKKRKGGASAPAKAATPAAASLGSSVAASAVASSLPSTAGAGGADGQGATDFRVAQMRKNVQHVDSSVCLYYGTKEGCRRGADCEYLHVSR